MIPRRDNLPRVGAGADKAVADFRSQISSVANLLLDEYRRELAVVGEGSPEQV
jgi:hypothetical protein